MNPGLLDAYGIVAAARVFIPSSYAFRTQEGFSGISSPANGVIQLVPVIPFDTDRSVVLVTPEGLIGGNPFYTLAANLLTVDLVGVDMPFSVLVLKHRAP